MKVSDPSGDRVLVRMCGALGVVCLVLIPLLWILGADPSGANTAMCLFGAAVYGAIAATLEGPRGRVGLWGGLALIEGLVVATSWTVAVHSPFLFLGPLLPMIGALGTRGRRGLIALCGLDLVLVRG